MYVSPHGVMAYRHESTTILSPKGLAGVAKKNNAN
jgi:hypothetical protein